MSSELVPHQQTQDVARAEDFLPLLSVEQAVARKTQINQYIHGIMKEGDDYGKMPGDTRNEAKKVLLKPGAEKLCSVFGLVPQYLKETVIEDWTGAEHGGEALFYYEYRCILYRGGRAMGEAIGSANSWETKYRYRWVSVEQAIAVVRDKWDSLPKRGGRISEPKFAIDKAETGGKYGKPMSYWQAFRDAIENGTATKIQKSKKDGGFMDAFEIDSTSYRISNPDVADVVNTLQKMAQKRALVAAVLVVTNCSDAFTQDMEDFEHGTVSDGPAPNSETETAKKAGPVQQTINATSEPVEESKTASLPATLLPKFQAWVTAGMNPLIEGLKEVKQLLLSRMPGNGAEEYQRVLDKHGVKPKGNDNSALRAALTELWNLQEQIPYKPQGVREYTSWSEAPDALDTLGQIRVAGVLYEANEDRTAFNKVEESNVGKET